MKSIHKYISTLLVLLFTFSVTSCRIEETINLEDQIIGRAWTGDVGLDASNGAPLFSTFRFGADGFGTETQYYAANGAFYQEYRYEWYWEPGYRSNVVLNYGRNGISYMRDLEVYRTELSGYFYLEHNSPYYFFRLKME